MQMKKLLLIWALALGPAQTEIFADSIPSAQTNKPVNKTYSNPLKLDTGLADPDVIKVDGKYYLYGTSHTRGFDVYVSEDLVNWTNKGLAFDDPRRGAWAPEVWHNKRGDGKFYLYYTDNLPNVPVAPLAKQIGVAVADSPLGPFADKHALESESIDAELFQDDDGKLYLYYVKLTGGFKIMAQEMSDPLTKKGEPVKVIHPTEPWEKASGEVTEGPLILKRNGTYYMMYSGSGADSPVYAIGYATSKSPMGPFVKYAGNPIVKRTDKIFGPGHHAVIEGPDNKLWLVYHQKKYDNIGWSRFLAIDPLWFDDKGVIHAKISRETELPAP